MRPIDDSSTALPAQSIDAATATPLTVRPIYPSATIEKVGNSCSLKNLHSKIKMQMLVQFLIFSISTSRFQILNEQKNRLISSPKLLHDN